MDEPNTFERRRAGKLADRGFELLDRHEYGRALDVARQVEQLREASAFEIAARAHAGMGELSAAVEVLERGLSTSHESWPNWQLLGNYRSDLGRFEEASEAYRTALECPGVWVASVLLNQAVLRSRNERHVEALAILERLDDEELRLQIIEARMRALYFLKRLEKVANLGESVLQEPSEPTDDRATLARIAALTQRVRFDRGAAAEEVRQKILPVLNGDRANTSVLTLVRDTHAQFSQGSLYMRVLVNGRIVSESGTTEGYFVTHQVVAENTEEAMRFVTEIESLDGSSDLAVEEHEPLRTASEYSKGVYWYGERVFYSDPPAP